MISDGLVVYNNKAGNVKVEKLIQKVKEVLEPHVDQLEFYEAEDEDTLKQYLSDDSNTFSYIWIMGGDGTVHTCVDALRKRTSMPVTAILPSGTCNDFARALGLPMDPVEAAKTSLKKRVKGIDIGVYNGQSFTNFVGIGIIADTSENINEQAKGTVGRFSYFMSALQTIKEVDSFQYELTADGEVYEGEAAMILVSNGNYLGTTPLPADSISLQDGLLDIFFIQGTGGELFREWIQRTITTEKMTDTEGVRHIQAGMIDIKTIPEKKVDADGEINSVTPLKIGILPQYMSFCCGEEY